MWRGQREALEDGGYRVLTPDLPGHGARDSERFSLDTAMLTIERAVADAAGPDGAGPVFLVGFSLGGYLAIHYAGLEHRPIAGLLAASCGTQPTRLVLDAWRLAAAVIHALPDRGLAMHNAGLRALVRDAELAADVNAGGVALEVMDDALRELRPLRTAPSLARIEQPVWLVNGTWDHFRLQERRYLRAARNARLVHIPRATHLVSVTQPAAFNRILFGALEEALA